MRTWSLSRMKHHIVNDNPFAGEEFDALLAQRTAKGPFFDDMPLIVLSRGSSDRGGLDNRTDEVRKKNQASLAATVGDLTAVQNFR